MFEQVGGCGFMNIAKVSAAMGFALLLGSGQLAVAEDAPAQPSETTETFGAWTVRCQKPNAEAPRACEVLHAVQGQGGIITQIAIGTPPGSTQQLLVVQAPLGVLVSQPVTIADQAAATTTIYSIPFQTCLQIGCLAQMETNFEALDKLAALATAKLSFAERTGRLIEISIPLNGMKDALARLRNG